MPKTFQELVAETKPHIKEVTVDDVKAKIDSGEPFVLIDVREDQEWDKGHLPRAVHVGRGVVEMRGPNHIPSPDTEVVCYCGGGARSALAAKSLQDMGYTNVASMAGGFGGWTATGYAVEQD